MAGALAIPKALPRTTGHEPRTTDDGPEDDGPSRIFPGLVPAFASANHGPRTTDHGHEGRRRPPRLRPDRARPAQLAGALAAGPHRLSRAGGLAPHTRSKPTPPPRWPALPDWPDGSRRWAASLFFPIDRSILNAFVRSWEVEPPGEPRCIPARAEPRPPRITQGHLALGLGPRGARRGLRSAKLVAAQQVVPGVEPLAGWLVRIVAQVVAAGQPFQRIEGQLADAERRWLAVEPLLGASRPTRRLYRSGLAASSGV